MMAIPDLANTTRLDCYVLVIGGGTAGTMAALTAAEHGAQVLLPAKAHVRHSGAEHGIDDAARERHYVDGRDELVVRMHARRAPGA